MTATCTGKLADELSNLNKVARRAAYGAQLIKRLSKDLSLRYKRGFSAKLTPNEAFFTSFFQHVEIRQTVSGELHSLGIPQTPSAEFPSAKIWQTLSAKSFPCPVHLRPFYFLLKP
ncbi:hypothetical protein DMI70_04530 [Escherichia coli]|nr:hypothetical protein [Escherichia coli]